jgi:hypothetical protein
MKQVVLRMIGAAVRVVALGSWLARFDSGYPDRKVVDDRLGPDAVVQCVLGQRWDKPDGRSNLGLIGPSPRDSGSDHKAVCA